MAYIYERGTFYFMYYIPYYVWGLPKGLTKKKRPSVRYFSNATYTVLLSLLRKYEQLIIGNTDESYLGYYE